MKKKEFTNMNRISVLKMINVLSKIFNIYIWISVVFRRSEVPSEVATFA